MSKLEQDYDKFSVVDARDKHSLSIVVVVVVFRAH